MLAAIVQSASAVRDDALRLEAAAALVLLMACAWMAQFSRWATAGVWVLGLASAVLMVVLPGPGAVIGVIAALVPAGLRLPTRAAVIAAAMLAPIFLAADAWQGRATPNLLGSALMAIGWTGRVVELLLVETR